MKPGDFNAIGWCHYTINFWWGCDEVSPACAHCYAREWAKFASRHLFGEVVEWGQGKARAERLEAARREALALERSAIRAGVRYRVFSLSMGDWLDEEVPIAWLAFMLRTIHETPHLDWLLLTKRPENWHGRIRAVRNTPLFHLARGGPPHNDATVADRAHWLDNWFNGDQPPANVWIGATVENQKYAEERIPALFQIPARVRFLSCEPLLGPVEIPLHLAAKFGRADFDEFGRLVTVEEPEQKIHWVIAGGESGPHARPTHPQWARSLRDQCAAAGVAFYWKQWGDLLPCEENLPWEWHFQNGKVIDPHAFPEFNDHPKGWHVDIESGVVWKRIGTKAAGRMLDGVEHSAFPDSSFVLRHSSFPAA